MRSFHYFMIAILIVMRLAHAQSDDADDEQECIEDRRPGLGMAKDSNSQHIVETVIAPADDKELCERECCALIDECNVVVTEKRHDGKYVCTLLKCAQFDDCMWDPKPSSIVTRMKPMHETNAEKTYAKLMEIDKKLDENGESFTTPNMTALMEEENEEVNAEFAKDFGDDEWNIDKTAGNVSQETTPENVEAWDDWMDKVANNDADSDKNNGDSDNENDSDENDNDKSDEDTNDDDKNQDDKEHDKNNDDTTESAHHNDKKPADDHTNGVWGINKIHDIDYNDSATTPFIVLGVIASIVFTLIVLIFVAKKISSNSERLKYRPLNESFPSSNPYHDKPEYGQYNDIE